MPYVLGDIKNLAPSNIPWYVIWQYLPNIPGVCYLIWYVKQQSPVSAVVTLFHLHFRLRTHHCGD